MRHLVISITIFCFVSLLTSCGQSQPSKTGIPLDIKIGQMLNVGFRGMQLADTNHIVRDITKYHLGSIILFDYDVPRGEAVRNIASPDQVKKLVHDLKSLSNRPLIVSIDQEGGKVARLKPKYGFPKTVSPQYLGSLNNADTTKLYAQRMANTLNDMGINMNFAPVVDLNTNSDNPIIGSLERSYSANPQVVIKQASVFVNMLRKHNIITVLKHFPGHGSSKKDSHLGVVDVTDTWQRKELTPYRQLIDSNLVDAVMTAHIFNKKLDTTYPATLSKPTITGMLRKELKFNGVIISDDLMMGAIRKEYGLKTTIKQSILAGVDMLTFSNNSIYDPEIVPKAHKIIKELITEGVISHKRINQSFDRIMKLKATLK